jgi:hypothetical protein
MRRNFFLVPALAVSLLGMQVALSSRAADDPKPKQEEKKKDKDKDKDKKDTKSKDDKDGDALKSSQATKAQLTLRGKIKQIDGKGMTLEVKVGRETKEVDGILIPEDIKVRVPYEPEFDEKGKPKKYKPDPSDKDRKLGGVKGSVGDLQEGASVALQLGKLKSDKKKLVALIAIVVQEKK